MKLDREMFLALTLGMAACAGSRAGSPVDEAALERAYEDPNCTGFDMEVSPMKCVAWKNGKVAKGYQPTEECVRWDEQDRCTAKEFVKNDSHARGE